MTLQAVLHGFSYSRRTQSSQAWRLHPCSFTLTRGTHALVGVNGAGKSTVLGILAGTLRGEAQLVIDGIELGTGAGRQRQGQIGFVPQASGLPAHMKVCDAIAYAAWLKGLHPKADSAAVERAMVVTDTERWAGHRCRSLSGGTARRVALACAIVHRPRLLLLDEPTTGLDPLQRESLHRLLQEHLAPYTVVATHLAEDVLATASQVMVMDAGRLRHPKQIDEALHGERTHASFMQFLRGEASQ